MKTEPALDKEQLQETLSREYEMEVASFRFVPKGFVTNSYILESTTGERAFLKTWNNSRWGTISAGRLPYYLPLTERLGELGLRVPAVIRTCQGDWLTRSGGLTLVLYQYLSGCTLDEAVTLPEDIDNRVARLVAQLHAITPRIGLPIPLVESFTVPFENTFLSGLQRLEELDPNSRHGQVQLKELLLPEKDRLLAYLDRLRQLGKIASEFHSERVACHTDINRSNLILADNGDLYLLDWEGLMLAPPEHDLFIFTGSDRFNPFLRTYREARGPVELHAETFGFYFYRRNLEDLTDWIVTILDENTKDRQDQMDLDGIRHDCIAGWPYLETGIETVRRQITASLE